MSAQDRWIFTKEQLRRVPSITESNMSVENELLNRQQAAKLCQEMGQKLKVSQWVINTGITFLHRFYCRHSFAKYPFKTMAPTSLFLAAKVEEQPRKLEHIIKVSQICIYRENVDPKSERYQSLAAQLVYSENLMLRTLGFDLNIQHAHTSIVNCCQLVRATKNIAETSYYLATNSLHLSTLCLQYKPTVVACICIYFVCKWSNFLIPKSHEGKEWWTYIDDTVNKEMLEGLMSECLQIFQKCPQRLKKSFTDNSKMNSISNSSSNNSNTNNITASATITNSVSSSSSNSNNKIHMISQHVKQQHFQPTGALPSIPPKPATAIVPATTPSFSNSSLLSATSLASSSSKDKSISKLENNVFSSLFSINENSQNSLNHSMNNMNSSTSMTLNFDLNSLNHTMDSSSLLNPDSDSLNHTFDASSLNADMDSNHTMDASYATDSISFNHNSGDASSNIDAVSQQEHTPVEAPASTLTTETADDSSDHSKKHKKKHKHKEKHKHKDKHKHKHKDKDKEKEKEKEKHREKYNVEPSFQIQQQPETGSKVAPLKLKILTTKRSRDELGDSSPVEDEGKIQPIKIKFSALSNHQRSSPESPDNIDLPVSRKRKRSDKKDIKKALKQVFSDLEANIDN